MTIKFESNDSFSTDNIVNIHQVTIIIRILKFYPQLFLDDALDEL